MSSNNVVLAIDSSRHFHPTLQVTSKVLNVCSMNPLGLKPERFVVAVDESGNDTAVLGFGQLQPHGNEQQPDFLELRTLIVDPAHRF